MAKNARKHEVPSGSDTSVSRETIFETFGNSIRDVVPVANTIERSLVADALTQAGQGPSPERPLLVFRADAPRLHAVEYTTDGVVWVPASGVLSFSSKGALDSFTTANAGYLTAGDSARVGSTLYRYSGSFWYIPGAVLVGADKGDTVCPAGSWRPLNTAAGVGTTTKNEGYTFGTGSIGVPHPNGLYDVAATISFPSAGAGTTRGVQITGASSYVVENLQRATVADGVMNLSVSGTILVAGGFTVGAYHDSGANRTVSLRHVSARYVGPV